LGWSGLRGGAIHGGPLGWLRWHRLVRWLFFAAAATVGIGYSRRRGRVSLRLKRPLKLLVSCSTGSIATVGTLTTGSMATSGTPTGTAICAVAQPGMTAQTTMIAAVLTATRAPTSRMHVCDTQITSVKHAATHDRSSVDPVAESTTKHCLPRPLMP
jgi:hypothetical protein